MGYYEDGACLYDVGEILLAKLVGPARRSRLDQFTRSAQTCRWAKSASLRSKSCSR